MQSCPTKHCKTVIQNTAKLPNIKKKVNSCGTAIITPFTEDGVNFEEFRKMIEFQIKEGADAIIVCGTTGESSTMTLEERKYECDDESDAAAIALTFLMMNGQIKQTNKTDR